MREQIEQRLRELQTEYETGVKQLSQLKQRKEDLESTLLRISGAILVLQELRDLPADDAPAARVDGRTSTHNGATPPADVA